MNNSLIMIQAVQLIESGGNINESRKPFGDTLLHDACFNSDILAVKYLIEHGSDVNSPNEYGNTPLHYSVCRCLNTDIIECLLLNGADRDIMNYGGETAGRMAQLAGKHDFVQFIKGFQDVPTKGVQAG
jgi:ankyrin repeat protein